MAGQLVIDPETVTLIRYCQDIREDYLIDPVLLIQLLEARTETLARLRSLNTAVAIQYQRELRPQRSGNDLPGGLTSEPETPEMGEGVGGGGRAGVPG